MVEKAQWHADSCVIVLIIHSRPVKKTFTTKKKNYKTIYLTVLNVLVGIALQLYVKDVFCDYELSLMALKTFNLFVIMLAIDLEQL